MFEENELATRFEHSSYTLNRVNHSGNGAKRERADHRIHTVRGQWNALSRQVQKFDIQLGLAAQLFGALNHPWVRLKCEDFIDSCPVVVGKIYAGTDTKFKNRAARQRNNPLANFLDGRRIPQGAYHLWIHVVSIERHDQLQVYGRIKSISVWRCVFLLVEEEFDIDSIRAVRLIMCRGANGRGNLRELQPALPEEIMKLVPFASWLL